MFNQALLNMLPMLIKSLGLDPAQLQAQVQMVVSHFHAAKQAAERVESKLDDLHTKLDMLVLEFARLHNAQETRTDIAQIVDSVKLLTIAENQ